MVVKLNRPEVQNAINTEMIFELESLFAWCGSHLEINSILLTSVGPIFSAGLDTTELSHASDEKVQKNLIKLQRIIYSMFYLPQTIIIDVKDGATGVGAELTIGGDIRIASLSTQIHFNHLTRGLVPTCGGIGFLGAVISKASAKNWILSSRPIPTEKLTSTGFINELYPDEECAQKYLLEISKQSQVARIQAKRSHLESLMPELERAIQFEKDFAFSGMVTGDWKKSVQSNINGTTLKFSSPLEIVARMQQESGAN